MQVECLLCSMEGFNLL